jgi:hypothetical protein
LGLENEDLRQENTFADSTAHLTLDAQQRVGECRWVRAKILALARLPGSKLRMARRMSLAGEARPEIFTDDTERSVFMIRAFIHG